MIYAIGGVVIVELRKRKKARLDGYDYSSYGAYFVTICVAKRVGLLWESAPTLSVVVGQMKRWISKQIGFSMWQKSFYDEVIKNQEHYQDVWQYIDTNPLRLDSANP